MKKKLAILLTLVALVWIVPAVLSHAFDKPAPQPQAVEQKEIPKTVPLNADRIFDLVNEERIRAGVKPLQRDKALDASAQTKADDMLVNKYFGHVNPATGVHGYTLIPQGKCNYQSENLAETKGFPDNNVQMVYGWMNSEGHREAILNPRYELAGIATSGGFAVQHFCDI